MAGQKVGQRPRTASGEAGRAKYSPSLAQDFAVPRSWRFAHRLSLIHMSLTPRAFGMHGVESQVRARLALGILVDDAFDDLVARIAHQTKAKCWFGDEH